MTTAPQDQALRHDKAVATVARRLRSEDVTVRLD